MIYISVVSSIPIGISVNQQSEISLSPNPATEELTINIAEQNRNVVVEMFNVEGKSVGSWQWTVGKKEKKINIKNFPAGVYFVKVFAGGKVLVKKVVKM